MFTHCYDHSLNLAANDTIKGSKLLKVSFGNNTGDNKAHQALPRHDAIFKGLKAENETVLEHKLIGIRVLYPTCWTVHADSLLSITENYSVLYDTWDEALEIIKDTESKAQI